nr:hypothetical protein [Tanacetum cinerariifolium]
MVTMIEQQVALDEALVPTAQRNFRQQLRFINTPSDSKWTPESTLSIWKHLGRCCISVLEFRANLLLSYHLKRKSWSFFGFLDIVLRQKTLTDVNSQVISSTNFMVAVSQKQRRLCLSHMGRFCVSSGIQESKKSNEMYYPRFTKVIINHFMTKKPSIPRQNRVNWHYVRDDILFTTIKVVSRHQNTQHYDAILPIELTTEDIRNTKAYKEYYACATGEAAPKPKASARRKRGGSDSSTTPPTPIATPTPITTVVAAPRLTVASKGKQPARATSSTDPSDVERTKAEHLKIVLRRSRQETHISQQGGSSIYEGTGSKPGVSDVPSDDSEEEISWNSSDDEDVDDQTKGRDDNEGEKTDESDDDDDDQDKAEKVNDDDDDEEEISKIDEQKAIESGEGDNEVTESDWKNEEEETREEIEESFDLIPRTPEDSEDDGNNEEDQGLRISEEERIHEEEEADELYRDVDINQGRGLQVSQDIEDSHVTLTLVHSDDQQESSLTSSFVTSLLNPIIDPGMESIFTTGSSSVTPIPSPKSTMTPSIITTTTTASQPPIPPTPIPSDIFQTLPTFASEMTEAVREAVQIQIDRLQDSLQRENDEFLRTIDDNMKKIIKEQMEGNKYLQRSDEQRNLYKALVEAYNADKTIMDSYGESAILKRRHEDDDDQEGPSAGLDRGSKRRREGGEHASASTPYEPATKSKGRSTTGTQSRQMSASEFAFAEEPMQTTCQMEEPSHPVFETELEYHLEEVYKATTNQLDWDNSEGQQYLHNLLQPLLLIPDNRGCRVIPFAHFINNDLEYLRGGASSRKYTTSILLLEYTSRADSRLTTNP